MRTALLLLIACSSNKAPSTPPAPTPIRAVADAAVIVDAAIGPAVLPDVTFESLGGFTYDRSTLAGHAVVVVFLATSDPASKSEVAMLAALANRIGDKVKFIGVLRTESANKLEIRDFLEGTKVPFPIGRQTDAIAEGFLQPGTTPTTFVFDRDGKRAAHHVGPVEEATLAAILAKL